MREVVAGVRTGQNKALRRLGGKINITWRWDKGMRSRCQGGQRQLSEESETGVKED